MLILILFAFLGTPIILIVINFYLMFCKKGCSAKLANVIDGSIFVFGPISTGLLFSMCGFIDWNESIVIGDGNLMNFHTPISFEFIPTFYTFCAIAFGGYIILRIKKDKLSPLIATVCISGIFMGIILCIVWCVQIYKNINTGFVAFFLLFPLNYVLCSIRLLRDVLLQYAKKASEINYKNRILNFCNDIIKKSPSLLLFSFFLILPILCVVSIVLLLFGQTPDGFIKMFTSTADWTLSQQIPPPPIEYKGHYLCTVAAGGDKKVVKPIRIGLRQNTKIIVNRQLCVANAFEDLIQEKLPGFHKVVRMFYDKYGYPLSKHITTRKRANAVYILMKPLEWLFLIVLYTFDQRPESRIAIQYTGRKYEN